MEDDIEPVVVLPAKHQKTNSKWQLCIVCQINFIKESHSFGIFKSSFSVNLPSVDSGNFFCSLECIFL
jgi:hypothetical protein